MSATEISDRPARRRSAVPVDIVAQELVRKRITLEEAAACEWLRLIWQPEGNVSGSNWSDGERVDCSRSPTAAGDSRLQRADSAKRLLHECTMAIGRRGMTKMRYVLTRGRSLTECARHFSNGKSGAYERFVENWREDLADLTDYVFVPETISARING